MKKKPNKNTDKKYPIANKSTIHKYSGEVTRKGTKKK